MGLMRLCTQHLAQHQYSVGFDGMSGSSHEPVALCSMAFRYPTLWRQGIPTDCVHWGVRTCRWPSRMSVNVGHYSPGPQMGKPWMRGKGTPFCTLSTKLSISNLPLESLLYLGFRAPQHTGREEERWFFSCFWVIRSLEGSTMWWKTRSGFF